MRIVEKLSLSAALVAEHYRRHCELGPKVDHLLGLFFSAFPHRVPVGSADAALLADAFAWSHRVLAGPEGGVGTALSALGDLDVLEAHTRERMELLGLLDQAAAAYASAHGHRGTIYATGGVTADAVHLYPASDEGQALTMPIAWALAYHATLS